MKKIFAFLLVFAFALSFAACAEDKGYTVRVEGGSSEAAQAEVWTMPSTVKILRDVDYSQYYADPVLEYDSAKNEYVSAQIIMTAKNDVSSYDLELSDLVSEDGTYFSRANFDVYNQHYVKVSTRTKDTSGETTETFTPVRSDPNLVTSFESYQEVVSDMKLLNFFGTARFVDGKGQYLLGEKDPDHPADRSVVTEGSYALKVEAQGDYRNTTEMPSIAVKTKMGGGSFDKYDFTDVDKILLDVYNANDTEQKVYVQYLTDSVTGSKLTSAYAATVPANSFKTVEIEIDRSFVSQLLNLEQISQVRICFDPETEYGQPTRLFYIDNLRLHTTDEPIDTSVALRKDNELESADKADYLSLWKTIGNYTFFPSQLTFNTDPAFIKGGTGSFKLSNVPGYYGPESINPVVYTIGWELSPLQKDISGWNGITYWVYNSYDQPLQDWVRRTIRSAEGDDSQDGFYNMLQPGWNQRTLTKEDLLELGFVLDDFSIFTLMFSVPSQDACDLYIDEIMFY